jgi:ParB-like chromosome segregation protein Spo0J
MLKMTKESKDYEFHKYCLLFPLIVDKQFEELQDDIKKNGLVEPIVTYHGKILDGRNRLLACRLQGVVPRFREYNGDNPLQFVLSKNLNRRHLSESQRATIAAEIATLSQSEREVNEAYITQADAAETLNVSVRLVRDAAKIKSESPEKFDEVKQGEKTIHAVIQDMKESQEPSHAFKRSSERSVKQLRREFQLSSKKLDQNLSNLYKAVAKNKREKFQLYRAEILQLYKEIGCLVFGKYS